MYSKSKRFIASFLAVLMAVCILPVDVLGGVSVVNAADAAITAKIGTDPVSDGTNAVDNNTNVTLSATAGDNGATHLVWTTGSDELTTDTIKTNWAILTNKTAVEQDATVKISGTAEETVTLKAVAVKYTPGDDTAEPVVEATVDILANKTYTFKINASDEVKAPTAPSTAAEVNTDATITLSSTSETSEATVTIHSLVLVEGEGGNADVYNGISTTDPVTADNVTGLKSKMTDSDTITAPATAGTLKVKAFAEAVKGTATAYSAVVELTITVKTPDPQTVPLTAAMITVGDKAVTGKGTTESPYVAEGLSVALTDTVTEAKPPVVVKVDGTAVAETEYDVTYASNTTAGTATVTVKPSAESTKFTADANGIVIQFTVTGGTQGGGETLPMELYKTTTWSFEGTYWSDKNISSGNITASHDLDGIKLNSGSTSGAVKAKIETNNTLSINKGGMIDIPVQSDTAAIEITINTTTANTDRAIKIGIGDKAETVTANLLNSGWTNSALYKKTDGIFSNVLTITGVEVMVNGTAKSGEVKILNITLKEYKTVQPADLTGATATISAKNITGSSAPYTGDAYEFETVVTKAGNTLSSQSYQVEYLREDNEGNYVKTDDLTSAGKIKAKAVSGTTSVESENFFEIQQIELTVPTDAKIVRNSATDIETDGKEFTLDITNEYFKSVIGSDSLNYEIVTEGANATSKGDVLKDIPSFGTTDETKNILKYTLVGETPTGSTPAAIVIKVTSQNYNDATFTITVELKTKTSIKVTLPADKTYTYNGEAYDFETVAKAEMTIADASNNELSGDDLTAAQTDLAKNLTFKFTKTSGEGENATVEEVEADELIHADTYTATATLTDSSDYSLVAPVTATFEIEAKKVKIQPKAVTWTKYKDDALTSHTAKTSEYEYVALDGDTEETKGLVENDTLATQPILKYYLDNEGTKTELTTDAAWEALTEESVVTVEATGAVATVATDYEISYESAAVTVANAVLTPIDFSISTTEGDTDNTFTAAKMPADSITANTKVGNFYISADADNTVNKEALNNKTIAGVTARVKFDKKGNQFCNSIGFKTTGPATLSMDVASNQSTGVRKLAVAKLNEDKLTVTECVGAVVTNEGWKGNGSSKEENETNQVSPYSADSKIYIKGTDGDRWNKVTVKLSSAGTYYIYPAQASDTSTNDGIKFYSVSVAYDAPQPEATVAITPTISTEDLDKLDGATLYFTATGETDVPVTAGTAVQLKKGVTYSLVAKKDNAVVQTITAKINGNASYLVPNAAASVTITVEVESLTASITPNISSEEAAKLDGAEVYFTATGEADEKVVSGTALQLKKGTTYTLVVKKDNVTDETMAAKINGSTEYAVTADATVEITIVTGLNPAERVAITPSISADDLAKLNDAKVYFTAPGEKLEVTSGTAVNLKKDVKYTLVVEKDGTTVANTTAQIGASSEYTPTAATTVTITISVTQAPTKPAAPTANPASGSISVGGTITLLPAGADIYYNKGTSDASVAVPTASTGTPYAAPIPVTEAGTLVIKAIVVENGLESEPATFTYTVRDNSGKTGFYVELLDDGTYTYTGSAIKPVIAVYNNDELLTEGVDYTVKYANNVNASVKKKATLTVTGKGRFSGSQKVEFTIAPKSLGDAENNIIGTGIETGNIVIAKGSKAAPVIIYNGVKLANKDIVIPNTKYNTVTTEDTPEEEKTVTITAKENGNFTGSLKLDVKVVEKSDLKNYQLKVALTKGVTYTYNGSQQEVSLDVKDANGNSLPETDHVASDYYYVSYNTADRTNAGVVKFTVYGTGDYACSVSKSFTIKPADKKKTTVSITGDPWSGSYEVPYAVAGATLDSYFDDEIEVKATLDGIETPLTLHKDRDYKVTYSANKKSGTAKATVNFIGNYKGIAKQQQTFTIKGREVNAAIGSADLEAINLDVKFGATKPYDKPGIYKAPVILSMDGITVKNSEFDIKYYTEAAGENGFDPEKEMKGKNKLTISSEGETTPDSATVYVELTGKAKGNFAGSKITGQYQVYTKATHDLSKAKVTFYTYDAKKGYVKSSKLPYTGEAIVFGSAADETNHTPYLEVSIGKDTVPTDAYKVEYVNNTLKGKATVIIVPNTDGDERTAAGSKTVNFTIAALNLKNYKDVLADLFHIGEE